MKTLSIITINLNNNTGLKKTIDSLVALRDFSDIEFILQDGLSSDESLIIANTFYRHNEIISEEDNGIYNAMNKAILRSTGRYLFFLNSGDYMLEPQTLLAWLSGDQNYDLFCFGAKAGNNGYFIAPIEIKFSTLWFRGLCHQAMIFRRDLFVRHGLYDETLQISGDWEFLLRIFTRQSIMYKQEKANLVYFDPNGISSLLFEESQRERKDIYLNKYKFFYDDYVEFMDYRRSKIINVAKKILHISRFLRRIRA